jgi:hypothetical protein
VRHNPQPRNPQPATRNRNPQPATYGCVAPIS